LWRCHWSLHRRNTSDLSSLPDKQSSHIFAKFHPPLPALCFACALLTALQWPDANNAAT
jgi:hypothetical protein